MSNIRRTFKTLHLLRKVWATAQGNQTRLSGKWKTPKCSISPWPNESQRIAGTHSIHQTPGLLIKTPANVSANVLQQLQSCSLHAPKFTCGCKTLNPINPEFRSKPRGRVSSLSLSVMFHTSGYQREKEEFQQWTQPAVAAARLTGHYLGVIYGVLSQGNGTTSFRVSTACRYLRHQTFWLLFNLGLYSLLESSVAASYTNLTRSFLGFLVAWTCCSSEIYKDDVSSGQQDKPSSPHHKGRRLPHSAGLIVSLLWAKS